MKKRATVMTIMVLLFLGAGPAFSEELSPEKKGADTWNLYNPGGVLVGTLKRTEEGNFGLYSQGGRYVGVILKSGSWIPPRARRRQTTITPEDARFYIDVLGAMDKLR